MSVTFNEFWTIFHGLIFGTIYLLAFTGGFEALWGLNRDIATLDGLKRRLKRLYIGTVTMAVICWVTVISGTYIVYPWYRDKSPASPRSRLLADDNTKLWHSFAMEWKEHVAWLAPILATAVAFIVIYYGKDLIKEEKIRKAVFALFVISFFAAAVAGLWGAFINKVAPII